MPTPSQLARLEHLEHKRIKAMSDTELEAFCSDPAAISLKSLSDAELRQMLAAPNLLGSLDAQP